MPYLPPEVILLILATPNIDLACLLRCTRVSKEWHYLIYDSNTLRARLFLPQRSASGALVEVKDPQHTALAKIAIAPDVFPEDRRPDTGLKASTPLQHVAIHPLLLKHRVVAKQGFNLAFALSYRVLRDLFTCAQAGMSSWERMSITEPPLSCIQVRFTDFGFTDASKHTIPKLDIPTGVTMKDLYRALWQSDLTRFMGLVPDDGSCEGAVWEEGGEPSCQCYDFFGYVERRLQEQERRSKEQDAEEAALRAELCARDAQIEDLIRQIEAAEDEVRAAEDKARAAEDEARAAEEET